MATMARKTCIAGVALLIACCFALLLMNDPAYADITATSGEVHEGDPPASVALNQHQHDDDTGTAPRGAHAFNEEQDYTTRAPIALDICIPGNPSFALCEPNARAGKYDRPNDFLARGGTIPAGTCIDS